MDNVLICRTGLDLASSTSINFTLPNLYTELDVNGQTVSGFFSINVTYDQVVNNITGTISSLVAFIYSLGWVKCVKDSEFNNNVTNLFWSHRCQPEGLNNVI